MQRTIGILYGNNGSSLEGLAMQGPIAAIPFGGQYRLLDFPLSSMVNSGIRTVGLITPCQNKAILEHVGAGKAWFLERKTGGLFILPGTAQSLSEKVMHFCLKDIALNIEYLEKEFAENVVISKCDQVFNMNYREALRFHQIKQADVTLIYQGNQTKASFQQHGISLIMDDEQRVTDFGENDLEDLSLFLNIVILRRQLLVEMVDENQTLEQADLIDIVRKKIKDLKVFGFGYYGYTGRINDVQTYYQCSMDLLDSKVRKKLLLNADRIWTKPEDNPPTQYKAEADVINSLIAGGCNIEGYVENSIIFQGVMIEKGALVKNSVIMPNCKIGAQSILEHVILDNFVEIHHGKILKGKHNRPLVVSINTIV